MEKYSKLYEAAFDFVCTRAGMDRALTDEAARKEVLAALESVFPLAQMPVFLTLRPEERVEQLQVRLSCAGVEWGGVMFAGFSCAG